MKSSAKYLFERCYPHIIAAVIVVAFIYLIIDISNNDEFKELLAGLITLDSIIIGFLGAIMPVVLSMKNESKFVKYVFEKDEKNLFSKYLKITIFMGLFNAGISLCMYMRDSMKTNIRSFFYYIWIWCTILFFVLTYRSMSHMIALVFSKDGDQGIQPDISTSVNSLRRTELEEKYKNK